MDQSGWVVVQLEKRCNGASTWKFGGEAEEMESSVNGWQEGCLSWTEELGVVSEKWKVQYVTTPQYSARSS